MSLYSTQSKIKVDTTQELTAVAKGNLKKHPMAFWLALSMVLGPFIVFGQSAFLSGYSGHELFAALFAVACNAWLYFKVFSATDKRSQLKWGAIVAVVLVLSLVVIVARSFFSLDLPAPVSPILTALESIGYSSGGVIVNIILSSFWYFKIHLVTLILTNLLLAWLIVWLLSASAGDDHSVESAASIGGLALINSRMTGIALALGWISTVAFIICIKAGVISYETQIAYFGLEPGEITVTSIRSSLGYSCSFSVAFSASGPQKWASAVVEITGHDAAQAPIFTRQITIDLSTYEFVDVSPPNEEDCERFDSLTLDSMTAFQTVDLTAEEADKRAKFISFRLDERSTGKLTLGPRLAGRLKP